MALIRQPRCKQSRHAPIPTFNRRVDTDTRKWCDMYFDNEFCKNILCSTWRSPLIQLTTRGYAGALTPVRLLPFQPHQFLLGNIGFHQRRTRRPYWERRKRLRQQMSRLVVRLCIIYLPAPVVVFATSSCYPPSLIFWADTAVDGRGSDGPGRRLHATSG